MRYHDFDLWIESSPAGLKLRSSCAEHGEYSDEGPFDLDKFRKAEHDVVSAAGASTVVVDVGRQLYSFAFAAAQRHIEWHFAQCIGAAGQGDNGVRVRLRVEDANVASIPWEFLYSEQMHSFLGVSTHTPVIRYLELPRPIGQLGAALPIKMLVIIPRAPDLATDVERKELVEALAKLNDVVTLTILDGEVTRDDIANALLSQSFHVIHFIGHGDFDGEKAVLALNGPGGSRDLIDHETLAQMLRNHASLKLVVLNSCRGGELSETKPLVGMAAALVKEGIPAVIAMQYEVRDDEAITFAGTFYRALFTGPDRGRVEIALSHARNALSVKYQGTMALGIPVLFTHAREGVLFDLGADQSLPDRPLSKAALHRDEATLATHKRNIELLTKPTNGTGGMRGDILSENAAYTRAAHRIRLRHASVITAVGVAVNLFMVSLLAGFQKLPPQLRAESYAVLLTDTFEQNYLDPSIAIVSIDTKSEAVLGASDSTRKAEWRSRHAQIIDILTRAKVRTIAFMLVFDTPSRSDEALASSIARARASGTDVVIGVDSFAERRPVLAAQLAHGIPAGPACLGDRSVHSVKMMPMVIAGTSSAKPPRIRSLALETVLAFKRGSADGGQPLKDGIQLPGRQKPIKPSEVVIAGTGETECPSIVAGDTLTEEYLALSPLESLRNPHRHLSYIDILTGNVAPTDLAGSLVIVGREVNDSSRLYGVRRGMRSIEQRTSVEIFADAVNSLLRGSLIHPLGQGGQFLFILVMAAIGAAIALVQNKTLTGAGLLVVALAAYVTTAMWSYTTYHVLLNTVFDFIALLTAFVAVFLLRRKWFT